MDETKPSNRLDSPRTRVLTRADVAALMTLADYRDAAHLAFASLADGSGVSPPPLHIPAENGGFHGKGALLRVDGRAYAALKLNGNFPGNLARGLPTIQGAILLSDAENGTLLAIMDSIEVTLRRTASATALAAHYLARPDASTLAVCGCGDQAMPHLEALAEGTGISTVVVWDIDATRRADFVAAALARGFRAEAAASLAAATRDADIIVTLTTSPRAFLEPHHVRPGTFVAAVGADNPHKSEIAPALMARARVVVDVLDQCLEMGDLHHALGPDAAPLDVYASLSDLVSGRRLGRRDGREITLFDSTGTAIQDVAAAIRIYERAEAEDAGYVCALGALPDSKPTGDRPQ